jgi:hypothetical protein
MVRSVAAVAVVIGCGTAGNGLRGGRKRGRRSWPEVEKMKTVEEVVYVGKAVLAAGCSTIYSSLHE